MALLSITELENLASRGSDWHVSIFMPTHRGGEEVQQDPIRLKNLVTKAREQLVSFGVRSPDAQKLLKPADDLEYDELFWRRQSDGLALFASQDTFRYYRLPYTFESDVAVSDRFVIKPLLPILSGDGQYYVLLLAQGGNQLFQGTKYGLGEADLHDAPDSIQDVLRWEDPELHLLFHTRARSPSPQTDRPAQFHGQGADEQDNTELTLRYFREVDEAVVETLQEGQAPLILLAPDKWQGLYRKANTYGNLMEEGISRNPNNLTQEKLHDLAWEIVGPKFEQERKAAAALYRQLAGKNDDQAAQELEPIVIGAAAGRVAFLFVRKGFEKWGVLGSNQLAVELHKEAQSGDEDLVDLAAVKTLTNSGTVYVTAPEDVPSGGDLAAIFRY